MRQIIGFICSLAVALLLAAAGLYFDVRTLTLSGVILFCFAAILWLYEWGRPKVKPKELNSAEPNRKRTLIDRARGLVATYSQGNAGKDSFREYLERTQTYAALRGHLSSDFLRKLNAPRAVYAKAEGARYEPLVEWFLDELDRLEREWRLT